MATLYTSREGIDLSNSRRYWGVDMADQLIREPDERSGPALAGREPILLPEQRKKAAERVRQALNR